MRKVTRTDLLQWTDEPLAQVRMRLLTALAPLLPGDILRFRVPDPELAPGRWSGQLWTHEGQTLRHRSYRNWIDLAETLGCRMVTPHAAPPPFVDLRLQKLDLQARLCEPQDGDVTERYGQGSAFYSLEKLEEPCFLDDLTRAYERVDAPSKSRVLDLGVHRGDELMPLRAIWDAHPHADRHCVGVDHCASAIAQARRRFDDPRFTFLCDDISHFETWNLDPFDLIISIGTLQCRGVQGTSIFPALLRRCLRPGGSVILGFPFLRYIDGEIRQGGQMRNFSQAEHALVLKDLMFYRKLLQRRAQRVTITGRYYLFITAWSGSRRTL